jgi:hypothetical protein
MLDYHFSGASGLFLAVIISFWGGCGGARMQRVTGQHNSVPQTSQGISLEASWRKKKEGLSLKSKDWPRQSLQVLVALLDQAPPDQVSTELERLRNSKTDYDRMSDYDQTLLQALIVRLLDRDSRDKIIYILSGKCPRYIATVPIELYFAIKSLGNLQLLFDAYQTAINEDARRISFSALAAAFRNLKQANERQDEFIARAKQWFLANQPNLKVNPYYAPNGLSKTTTDFFLIDKH